METKLPIEIYLKIFEFLDARSILNVSSTCKSFREIISIDKYWDKILWNIEQTISDTSAWNHIQKLLDARKLKYPSETTKRRALHILPAIVCGRCFNMLYSEGNTRRAFRSVFGKRRCLKCIRILCISKTKARADMKSTSISDRQITDILSNLRSFRSGMNGTNALYYLKKDIRHKSTRLNIE